MKKTVTVYSNDPETPQLVLTLAGELWVDVAAEPSRISFRELRVDDPASQTLTLSVTNPDEVRITDVTLDDDHFSITPVAGEDTAQKRYEVVYRGHGELGRINDRIRVAYTGPDGDQHVDVPLWAQIVGDLRYPNAVFFGKRADGYEARKVKLSTRSGKAVRILSAKDPKGLLDAKILKGQGPEIELELSVNEAHASVDSARGQIEIRTTDRLEPKVTLPYTLHGSRRSPRLTRPALKRGALDHVPSRGATRGDGR